MKRPKKRARSGARTSAPVRGGAESAAARDTRGRVLESAGRGFRAEGFAGLGIDALARDAGLTSGAFYAQFRSKADALNEALRAGLQDVANGIDIVRAERGANWHDGFVEFYLTVRRHCAPTESCALQSMTADVARLGPATREIFDEELRHIVERMTDGVTPERAEAERVRALALLSLVSGAVSLARASKDPALGDEIIAAAHWLASRAIAPPAT